MEEYKYLNDMIPIQKLDYILNYMKRYQKYQFIDYIWQGVNSSCKIPMHEIERILDKLVADKFIIKQNSHTGNFEFMISYDGYLFHGYEHQAKLNSKYESRKNIRDWALTWGTVLAGVAASLLLIWQIFSYFYPVAIHK